MSEDSTIPASEALRIIPPSSLAVVPLPPLPPVPLPPLPGLPDVYQQGSTPMVYQPPQATPLVRSKRWSKISFWSIFASPVVDIVTLGTLGWVMDLFGWIALISSTVFYIRAKKLPHDSEELKRARTWLWVSWSGRIIETVLTLGAVVVLFLVLGKSGIFDISKYLSVFKMLNGNSAVQ
jgi:hypothetical protein